MSNNPRLVGLAALAVAATLAALAAPAGANPLPTPPPNQLVADVQASINWCSETPHVIGTGDFNGDGYIDIYCHSLATGKTWIAYAGNPGGTLTFSGWSTPIALTGWCYGGTATFGVLDVNGDGYTDFYCHDTGNGGSNWIATNKGGGVFQSAFLGTNWCGPGLTFTITDLDGDGRSDALCYNPSGGAVFVAPSNGTGWSFNGSLKLNNFCNGTGGNLQFGVADFNNDHKIDVYCHDFNSGNTTVSLSGGTTLAAPTTWMSGWCIGGQGFGIGDFDGDHYTDVWCYNGGNYTVGANIDSAGWQAFISVGNYATGYCMHSPNVVVGDKGTRYVTRYPGWPSLDSLLFNGDAKTDVACITPTNGRVSAGLSDNAHTRFVSTDQFYTAFNFCNPGGTLLTGDFNGDGATDLACLNGTTTQIYHTVTAPMTYHGGGIVTGPVKVNLIFYGAAWGNDMYVIDAFANNLSGSPYWQIMSRFNDGLGHTVPATFTASSYWVSTYTHGTLLGWTEIYGVISDAYPTADPNTVYVVLLDSASSTAGYPNDLGAHGMGGAYHGVWIGNPANTINGNNPGLYSPNDGVVSPNNAPIADAMIPVVTHEIAESLTDPNAQSWNVVINSNTEVGDMCAGWLLDQRVASNGSVYTQTLNGANYVVPMLDVPIDPYTTFCSYAP